MAGSLGFYFNSMVMELVSGLSLANHSDSEFFLGMHALLNQDGCQREGFWEVVGQVVSPFAMTSCCKTNGYYGAWPQVGGFSQCASPNIFI